MNINARLPPTPPNQGHFKLNSRRGGEQICIEQIYIEQIYILLTITLLHQESYSYTERDIKADKLN